MPRKAKPPSDQPVAARLRLAREALGLTQKKFAHLAGIQPATFNPWETGERPLPLTAAMLLCKRYGISLDWLYFDDPTRMPEWITRYIATGQSIGTLENQAQVRLHHGKQPLDSRLRGNDEKSSPG